MIFNSTSDMVDYLDELLETGVQIRLDQLNKILKNNSIEVEKTILVEAGEHKLFLEEIREVAEKKVEIVLTSPSWIKALPSIYHDNEFLQNFLFGFQTSALMHQDIIDRAHEQFDPSQTEFIDWLCTWVGIRFSTEIDDRSKRRVLHNIVRLYKMRGTKAYFSEMIEYLSGAKVEIDDDSTPEHLHGTLQRRKHTKAPAAFIVHIKKRLCEDEEEENRKLHIIHQILKAEKPINIEYSVDYPFANNAGERTQTTEQIMDMHYESSYDYDDLRE